MQGDIVAIYGANGTKYVNYSYDAWGNHTVTYTNNGNSIVPVANNPLRYRGYYYDADLGLYYLQTRYYDSYSGRFISPDAPENLGADQTLVSYNLYAYCSNNPVMYTDPTGESWFGAIVGAAVNLAVTFFATVSTNQEYTLGDAITAVIAGGIAGGVSPEYAMIGAIGGAVVTGVGTFLVNLFSGYAADESFAMGVTATIASFATISTLAIGFGGPLSTGLSAIVGSTFGFCTNLLGAAIIGAIKKFSPNVGK